MDQRRNFTPFFCSVDGLIGVEAKEYLRRLSLVLSQKWSAEYSKVYLFIKSRISISIARASHARIRRSRVPINKISNQRMQFEDGSALGLYDTLI